MTGARKLAGMTLLEVLVSLAIFALAAVCLGAAYANTLEAPHAATRLEKENGDWRVVRSLVAAEADPAKAARGGDMRLPDGQRLTWEVEILATPVMDLFEVRITGRRTTVTGAVLGNEEAFRVLRPTWSDPAERDKLRQAAQARRPRRATS